MRWSGASYDVSVTALSSFSTTLYAGASSEILSIDSLQDSTTRDPVAPTQVVDIASAFPGMSLGSIVGLAAAPDGTHLCWTQRVGSTSCLLGHDLTDSDLSSVTVLLTATAGDAFNSVAVDDTYAYTIGTLNGALYALAKDGNDGGDAFPPLATSALATAPIVAQQGQVFFVSRIPGFGASGGTLEVTSVGAGEALPFFNSAPVQTFALNNGYLFFGSGNDIMYSTIPTQGAQPLVGTPSASPIAGVAASNGYVAFFSATALGFAAEPQ